MMHYFGGHYTALEDVFHVSKAWAELGHKKFRLVGVIKRNGKSLSFSTSWKKAPGLPFGYAASTAKGLANALESGQGYSFFFPDDNAHPDYLAILEEKESHAKTVLLAQAKWSSGKHSKKEGEYVLDRQVFFSAVKSVDPDGLYLRTDKVRPDHVGEVLTHTDNNHLFGQNGVKSFATEEERTRIYAALDEMLNAERGDVDEPAEQSFEADGQTTTGGNEQSVPKVDKAGPSRESRSKTKVPPPKTDEADHGIPRFLRTLAIGPVATPLFRSEADRPHKYPLLLVRNERMAEYFGKQWYNLSKQSRPIDPHSGQNEQLRVNFFSQIVSQSE